MFETRLAKQCRSEKGIRFYFREVVPKYRWIAEKPKQSRASVVGLRPFRVRVLSDAFITLRGDYGGYYEEKSEG